MLRHKTATRNLQQIISDFDTAEIEMANLCDVLDKPTDKKSAAAAVRHESDALMMLEAAQARMHDMRRALLRHPHLLDSAEDTTVLELYRLVAGKCRSLHAWAEQLLRSGHDEFFEIFSVACGTKMLILPTKEPDPTTQPLTIVAA